MYAYWHETKNDLNNDIWSDRFTVSSSSPFELVKTAFEDYKTIDQEFMYFKVKILPGEYALITKSMKILVYESSPHSTLELFVTSDDGAKCYYCDMYGKDYWYPLRARDCADDFANMIKSKFDAKRQGHLPKDTSEQTWYDQVKSSENFKLIADSSLMDGANDFKSAFVTKELGDQGGIFAVRLTNDYNFIYE